MKSILRYFTKFGLNSRKYGSKNNNKKQTTCFNVLMFKTPCFNVFTINYEMFGNRICEEINFTINYEKWRFFSKITIFHKKQNRILRKTKIKSYENTMLYL